jgi:3-mercaptopyruvate sulfurtransferase SseA
MSLLDKQYNNEKELFFSCGSGMIACIEMLTSQIYYGNSLKVYDGS